MDRFTQRRGAARASLAAALVALVCLGCAASALAAGTRSYARAEPVCRAPGPGEASCFAMASVPVPAGEAGQPGVRPLAARPADVEFGPSGGLTPELLESAYGFDARTRGSGATVAIVDAYDDPTIEADLAEFTRQYGLPECTSAKHCFEKVGQNGSGSSLPTPDPNTGWSVEIALDVEAVHAACQSCHILLVEAKDNEMKDLGLAVARAADMGAEVISNSYGGPEQGAAGAAERALYEHPGTVIAAATGDVGYYRWAGVTPEPGQPDAPASYPGVVSVGGTTLTLDSEGRRSNETVWNGNGPLDEQDFHQGASGGGCSISFEAPFWQHYVPGFGATGCGDKRLSADVSAVADPNTGFAIYDSYDCGSRCEQSLGWSKIGGTSLSTPLISSMYALAGGADGIVYPAMTLYAHLGDATSLFDVTQGGNGYCDFEGRPCGVNAVFEEQLDCEGTTACNASAGYDGPSGVGAPTSISAFEPVAGEEAALRARAEETIAAEARRKAEEEAARQPKAPPASSGQGGTAGFKATKAAVAPAAVLQGSRLHAARGDVVALKVACPAGATRCEGTITVRTLGAGVARAGTAASALTLASGRFKVAGGHVVSVRLHLTRRGAALLRRKGKIRVRVTIAAHDPAGVRHSSRATVTLFAPGRR